MTSLILFCCFGNKTEGGNISYWSRVWMFPVLTPLFIMAILFSWPFSIYPAQFSLALLGYSWFLIALITLLCRRFKCFCGMKSRGLGDVEINQTTSDLVEVENIYENDQDLKNDLM